jgi:hypothetical protein
MKNNADYKYPQATRQHNIRAMLIVGTVSLAVCAVVFLAQLTMGVLDEPQGGHNEATAKSTIHEENSR